MVLHEISFGFPNEQPPRFKLILGPVRVSKDHRKATRRAKARRHGLGSAYSSSRTNA